MQISSDKIFARLHSFPEHPLYVHVCYTCIEENSERGRRASRVAIHYLAAISVASWRGRRSLRAAPSRESLAYLNATQHI